MGYYKVLGGVWVPCGEYKYNYWKDYAYGDTNRLSFKIFLLDKCNKLWSLSLRCNLIDKLNSDILYDAFHKDKCTSVKCSEGYYYLKESNTIELELELKSNKLKQVPKDKTKDTVFILEGGDINNHLFYINKYGNPDEYDYTGNYEIHNKNWVCKDWINNT